MMKIGIMQGRLSQKPNQPLQSFPLLTWKKEFTYASTLGIEAIEWLLDGTQDDINPITTQDGRNAILEISKKSGVKVSTLCAHSFIDGKLIGGGNEAQLAEEKLNNVFKWADKVDIDYVILPAMDKLSLRPHKSRKRIKAILKKLLRGKGPTLLLECDLSATELSIFVNSVKSDRIALVYDLGNAQALGFNIEKDLAILMPMIKEIHIKDRRNNNGPSCRLGSGDTPFYESMTSLAKARWDGPLVLETPIFEDWKAEAEHNLTFIKNCLDNRS